MSDPGDRFRRWCIPVLFGVLLIQFVATYVSLLVTKSELWPSVVLPGFGGVHDKSEMQVTRLEIEVRTDAGHITTLTPSELLPRVPRSMRPALTRPLSTIEHYSPELETWLLRHASDATGGHADRVTLRWSRRTVSIETGQEISTQLVQERNVGE